MTSERDSARCDPAVADATTRVLALSGGVGGAKLALGLAHELLPVVCRPGGEPDADHAQKSAQPLHVLVNTADDFEHLGLHISPDIDTLLYTLSGLSDPQQGWGLADESFAALEALQRLGGESWFRLGDKDLATHLLRRTGLSAGHSLSAVTSDLVRRHGIAVPVHPMSDDPVRTRVMTAQGELAFQHYFVRERCEPEVTGFRFAGIEAAAPNPAVMSLLQQDVFSAVVICPSNPFVSIDPILQLEGLWPVLRDCSARVILVSPIVAGMAIKGPAAKMMAELQMPVTALGVAQHYAQRYPGLVDYFVIDQSDVTLAPDIAQTEMAVDVTTTVMKTLEDKQRLARRVLELAAS